MFFCEFTLSLFASNNFERSATFHLTRLQEYQHPSSSWPMLCYRQRGRCRSPEGNWFIIDVKTKNRRGPNTDPCGTTLVTFYRVYFLYITFLILDLDFFNFWSLVSVCHVRLDPFEDKSWDANWSQLFQKNDMVHPFVTCFTRNRVCFFINN